MKLGIFFGGQSTERDVSFMTCHNIYKVLKDISDIELALFELDQEGRIWLIEKEFFEHKNIRSSQVTKFHKDPENSYSTIDIFFSLIHGNLGEDGGLQGFFRTLNKPFVGCSTLSSAVCMDKDFTKRLLSFAEINVADWLVIENKEDYSFEQAVSKINLPFYIKPANLGSSVGISRVTTKEDYLSFLDVAFKYDKKVLLEQEIIGIEVECGVIGNEELIVSEVGSIETGENEFYDYTKKYTDEHGATLSIPATIQPSLKKEVQRISKIVYKTLECQGLARIDFFIDNNKNIIVSEVNTVPGFTSSSMFPLLFNEIGMSYEELLLKLIGYGFAAYEKQNAINYDY